MLLQPDHVLQHPPLGLDRLILAGFRTGAVDLLALEFPQVQQT